ncbi:MAG: DUF5671 domain-containing protein [Parcubacteria group bacterium]
MQNEQTLPKRNLPRDVFLHLLAVVTLYWSAGAFITILFQYANYFLPDQLMGNVQDVVTGPVRFAIASLIIVFPVFILISWFLERIYRAEPQLREMKLRKWLIYFTLFVAAIIIIGDLVNIILVYLGAGITGQFIAKALGLIFVALMIFGYYLNDIRQAHNVKIAKAIVWAACVLVLVSVVGAFFIIGSPKNARLREYDQRKIGDLQSAQYMIANYWQRKGALPATLADLTDQISGSIAPSDSQTTPPTPYEYRIVDAKNLQFELCANFNLSADVSATIDGRVAMPVGVKSVGDTWPHDAGRVCFIRTIDKQLYPPLNK